MDLSTLGATTCGVWTRRQALAVTTPGAVRRFVEDGTWQVPVAGVYADGGHALDAEQRAYAAVLATDGGHHPAAGGGPVAVAACGRTAARVWGFPLIDDDDPATQACQAGLDDVHVRGGGRPRRTATGQLRRHDLVLPSGALLRAPSGLVLTSPVRTLVHCAALLTAEALVCAIDDALRRRVISLAALADACDAQRGEPGAPALRRAVGLADGRAESPAETLARLLLLPALPGLQAQVPLLDRAGRLLARFDLADRAARFAVEADGKRGHAGPAMVARDRQRDRVSAARGWHTERVTWFELRRQQRQVVRRVVASYADHAARAAGGPGFVTGDP